MKMLLFGVCFILYFQKLSNVCGLMAISRFISCFNVTILKETEISQVSGKWKKSKTSPLLYT